MKHSSQLHIPTSAYALFVTRGCAKLRPEFISSQGILTSARICLWFVPAFISATPKMFEQRDSGSGSLRHENLLRKHHLLYGISTAIASVISLMAPQAQRRSWVFFNDRALPRLVAVLSLSNRIFYDNTRT